MDFLDFPALADRKRITDRIADDLGFCVDFGFSTRAEAKAQLLLWRTEGHIDDDETEGLIERLRLGDA